MIIAVDFDGTLQIDGKPNAPLIERLKLEQRAGNAVILWTCREGKSLLDAVQFLQSVGFYPNLINQNHPTMIKKFKGDSRKIFADVYIDDKAVKA